MMPMIILTMGTSLGRFTKSRLSPTIFSFFHCTANQLRLVLIGIPTQERGRCHKHFAFAIKVHSVSATQGSSS
jgi:hypothetical protein